MPFKKTKTKCVLLHAWPGEVMADKQRLFLKALRRTRGNFCISLISSPFLSPVCFLAVTPALTRSEGFFHSTFKNGGTLNTFSSCIEERRWLIYASYGINCILAPVKETDDKHLKPLGFL